MCLSIWQKRAEQIYSAQRNCRKTEYFQKYMEGILKTLVDCNLLEGVKGKGGGYKLTKEPKDYSLGEILRLTEGDLASVPCTSKLTNIAIIWNRVPHILSGNSLTI